MRPDQSEYLAHFTKGKEAYDSLVSILNTRVIWAGQLPWTKRKAVCFTECPWSSLLAHAEQYSPYGVGFKKPRVFAAGGGPAYYVRADHFDKQQWEPDLYTFVTPFWPAYRPPHLKDEQYLGGKTIDYAHEREWRIPHEFKFEYAHVEFVILDSYEDMARFPKELKDVIGREKFILMDMYRKIEDLWPTHLVGGNG
ncbi:MAG: terminase [Dechloromonas sp.]|nr:MAG: terminase [Dechloromonas sp.]